MATQSKVSFADYLSIFRTVKDQLGVSIDNQFEVLKTFLNDEFSTAQPNASSVLTNGLVFSYAIDNVENEITCTIIKKGVDDAEDIVLSEKTLSYLNLDPNEILYTDDEGFEYSIQYILSDIGSSYKLNQAVYQITASLMTATRLNKDTVYNILDTTFVGSTLDTQYQTLRALIAQLDGEIKFRDWASILANLYGMFPAIERQESFELDDTTVSVKGFIGTSLIQIVGTVVQMIGLIVSSIAKILGLLLTFVGTIINWVANLAGVTANAKINTDSGNFYLNAPLWAFTRDSSTMPEIASKITPNGPAMQYELPGSTIFIWRKVEGEVDICYINAFINLNVNPIKFLAKNRSKGLLSLGDQFFEDSTPTVRTQMYVPKNAFQLMDYDADCNMTMSDILRYEGDDDFWALAACLAIMMTYEAFQQDAGGWNNNDRFDRYYGYQYSGDYGRLVFVTVRQYQFGMGDNVVLGADDRHPSNYWSFIADALSYQVTAPSGDNEGDRWYMNDQTKLFRVAPYCFIQAMTEYYQWLEDTTSQIPWGLNSVPQMLNTEEVESMPKDRLVTLPNYTKDALLRTLLSIGAIVAVGTVAVAAFKKFTRPLVYRWRSNNLMKLNELRSQALSSGNYEDWLKFAKAIKWYNTRSSIFGLGSYDAANGWITNSVGESSTSAFVSTSLNNSTNGENVIKRMNELIIG